MEYNDDDYDSLYYEMLAASQAAAASAAADTVTEPEVRIDPASPARDVATDQQMETLADIIQAALMLRINERKVG